MFCGNCGAQNPDGAAHCGNCGAPLARYAGGDNQTTVAADQFQQPQYQQNQYQQPQYQQPQYQQPSYQQPAAKNKNKVIGIVAAVAVIAVVVILAIVLFGGGSAKSVAEDFVNAALKGDTDKIIDCISDDLIESMAKEEGLSVSEAKREFADGLESEMGDYAAVMGMIDFKVKATDEDDYDRDELRDIKDLYEDYDVTVKDGVTVEVEISLEFMGEKESESMDIPMVKIGGSWYVDALSMGIY